MKRFLISFVIGMTLIAAGATMTFIEIQTFDFVDIMEMEDADTKVELFTLENNDVAIVNVDDLSYTMKYDDQLKENEVKVVFREDASYRRENNRIDVYDDDWHYGISRLKGSFDRFVKGLKEHKIYTYYDYDAVYIYTNHKSRDRVRVNH